MFHGCGYAAGWAAVRSCGRGEIRPGVSGLTTWLNIAFLILAAALVVRFARTGGLAMLRMMGGSPDSHEHDHTDAEASH